MNCADKWRVVTRSSRAGHTRISSLAALSAGNQSRAIYDAAEREGNDLQTWLFRKGAEGQKAYAGAESGPLEVDFPELVRSPRRIRKSGFSYWVAIRKSPPSEERRA